GRRQVRDPAHRHGQVLGARVAGVVVPHRTRDIDPHPVVDARIDLVTFLLESQAELVQGLPLQQLVAAGELETNLAGDFTRTLADAGGYFVHPVAEGPLVGERLRDGDVGADDAVRGNVGRADLPDRVQ